MIVLNLPEPPSVNAAYSNVNQRGRVKTKAYRNWETECLWMIKQAKPGIIKVTFIVTLFLSEKTRKDVDNCLKPTLDLLSKCGITKDDKWCYAVVSTKSPDVETGKWRVAITNKDGNESPIMCVSERAARALEERNAA